MYIPHAANSEESICCCEMSCLEGSRFHSKVFVGRWEFERCERGELLCLRVLRL